MAGCTDKVVKALEPANMERLKQWRKKFNEPLRPDEIKRAQRLTQAAEALWQQHAAELARVRKLTSDELHVWPDKQSNRAPTTTAQKDAVWQREMLSEKVKNASPVPATQARDGLLVRALVLAGHRGRAAADAGGVVVRPRAADPRQCAHSRTQARRRTCSRRRRQDRGWTSRSSGIATGTSILTCCSRRTRGSKLAQSLADQQRFLHWELEFADVFKARGGFDLILGNPPWIKVTWNEQALLSDFDPRFAIEIYSAKETADRRGAVFSDDARMRGAITSPNARRRRQCRSFLNATQNYSVL